MKSILSLLTTLLLAMSVYAQSHTSAALDANNPFTGNETHAGTETFNGPVIMNNPFTTNSTSVFNGTVTFQGTATFSGMVITTNPFTAMGKAAFENTVTFEQPATFDAAAYFGSGAPWYDVKAFGAKGDGVTDDTAAITAAYAQLAADLAHGGGGTIYFPHSSGPYKFSTLTIPSGGYRTGWIVSVFDNGLTGGTIKVGSWNAFMGRSGNFQGLGGVFVYAPNTTWTQDRSYSNPLVDLAGVSQVYFEGINIVCSSTAECFHMHDSIGGVGTIWVTLENSVVGNTSSGYDIIADSNTSSTVSGFGFFARHSSIHGTKTASFTNFGQIFFHECFIGGGTVTQTNAGISITGDITFDGVLSEGLNNQDFFVAAGTYVNDITFRAVSIADPVGRVYVFNNQTTGNPRGPVLFEMIPLGNDGSGLMDPAGTYVNVNCFGSGCPSWALVGSVAPETVANLPSAAAYPYAQIPVSDSTTISKEGQTCVGGSSTKALAFSDGSVWKCF